MLWHSAQMGEHDDAVVEGACVGTASVDDMASGHERWTRMLDGNRAVR